MGCHSTKELDQDQKFKINPIYSPINTQTIENGKITENQIQLVRNSWKELSKKGDFKKHGIEMMIKIFVKHPEVKHIWKFAAKLETEGEMRQNAQLRSHGNNVFEAINAGVNWLDKANCMNNSLVELGKKHTMYGAKKCYFVIMRDAFIEVLNENIGPSFNDETRNAWIYCFDFFTDQMSKGLME